MDENVLFLAMLIVVLFALAFFSNFSSTDGPIAIPPDPDAEFGVVREQRTFIGFNNPPPPTSFGNDDNNIVINESEADKIEVLRKAFRVTNRNAKSRNVDTEYIQIEYNPSSNITVDVSDWTLSNKRGSVFKIGNVTNFPGIGNRINNDRLVLNKGGRVYIITGSSPRGESFRENKCVEYFEQSKTYVPPISTNCPAPSREPGQDGFNDECFLYMRKQNSCRIPTVMPPASEPDCREYVIDTINYSGCIANHRNDSDFFGNEWWVYLRRPEHIWSDIRETITLTDTNGNVIANLSYN
jgi:hypothetical protein